MNTRTRTSESVSPKMPPLARRPKDAPTVSPPSSIYFGPSIPTIKYVPSYLKTAFLRQGRRTCSASVLVDGRQDNTIQVEAALPTSAAPSGTNPSTPSPIPPTGEEGVSVGAHSDKLNKIGPAESTNNSKTLRLRR